jgi:hypothetical protein
MFGNFDINFIIFGVMPYVALTVFLVGSIARYERDPFTWKSASSQLLRRKQLVWGSILFHVGILTVFFGHLIGLFTPIWVLDALGIPYGLKQWMAVLIGGPAGIAALVEIAETAPDPFAVAALAMEAEDDPSDLEALDKVWEESAVVFGPDPNAGCPVSRDLLARMDLSAATASQGG